MMLPMTDGTIRNGHFQLIRFLHGYLVHKRRVAVLSDSLKTMLPASSTLLDVGCGDGTIAKLLSQKVPGLKVMGVEYAPRPSCAIPCTGFDGIHLPFPDKSFDGAMFVDVLHHSLDPLAILRDASRVCRNFILIKDHFSENLLDYSILRLMDWVGNRPHAVVLPYNYLSEENWKKLYSDAGLTLQKLEQEMPLYPVPFSFIFGGNLHFISVLTN